MLQPEIRATFLSLTTESELPIFARQNMEEIYVPGAGWAAAG
jgi:hypothetical protein